MKNKTFISRAFENGFSYRISLIKMFASLKNTLAVASAMVISMDTSTNSLGTNLLVLQFVEA